MHPETPDTAKKNLLVVIAGPTASGKTALAIEVATHFNTSILSADSRQCYSELNIGVARPTPEELSKVPHYFIATHSIHNTVTAATYEQYGLQVLQNIFQKKKVAVVAGGTGLYIQALLQGLDAIPPIPQALRDEVRSLYAAQGIDALQQKLHQYDARYAQDGDMQNPQRMMRALEVAMHTGTSIRQLQQGMHTPRPFRVLYLVIDAEKEWLQKRISLRTQAMLDYGLINEVQGLYGYKHLNALQTVGYKEIFDYLHGSISLPAAMEQITIHTRQYAKRQRTWFGKVAEAIPIPPDGAAKAIAMAETIL